MPIMFHRGKILFKNGGIAMSPACCCNQICTAAYEFYGFIPVGPVADPLSHLNRDAVLSDGGDLEARLGMFGLWSESEAWNFHYIYFACGGEGGNDGLAWAVDMVMNAIDPSVRGHFVLSSQEAITCTDSFAANEAAARHRYETLGGSTEVAFERHDPNC